MINEIKIGFFNTYEVECENIYFSPGRVNLIGEHLDYNGGYVLPMAIELGTYVGVSIRTDSEVLIYSKGFSEKVFKTYLNEIKYQENEKWINYILGCIEILRRNNYTIDYGFNLYINTNLPLGSGLSSSASIETLILYMLNDLFKLNIDKTQIAKLGQLVENDFIGLNSGIMDQFSVVHGLENNALLINTRNLEYEYIPLMLGDYNVVLIDSNKKRELTNSFYNNRFDECMQGLDIMKKHTNINYLTDLSLNEVIPYKKDLGPIVFKRIKHVISEQKRVLKAKEHLMKGNVLSFSKLLIHSHNSLKNNYEVSSLELNLLVDLSIKYGSIGARMTGAGFGGCIICLVKKDLTSYLIENVVTDYSKYVSYIPKAYVVTPSGGTKRIYSIHD